jgi:hypothetical protein
MDNQIRVPVRYIPKNLTRSDRKKQIRMLKRSRSLYKRGKYYTRKRVPSFKSRKSSHLSRARTLYGVEKITPNEELARATGCSVEALEKIVNKGEGAYFSSGSRPNQTAQSWGYARLASAITSGNAAIVDYHIIDEGCDHSKPAFKLAEKRRKQGKTQTRTIKIE